ncbi:putative methyltransferase [Actinoplanes missouriensis 431]|uniref:Putative methyltransferase n=2 Tax=Actinoplanes missouriensis TaxID=1866 RepID=I0H7C8_ACTM4|nr:putative methyltransferase [Actinoplanes missouriensis 431]
MGYGRSTPPIDATMSIVDLSGVRLAYDTVAEEYAARMPDTRVESALDLAMVDAFISAVRFDSSVPLDDGDLPVPAEGPATDDGALPVPTGVARLASGTDRVLDAGCGAGRMSRYLADRGCRVEGVDLSPGMIAMARRDHPDLSFTVAPLAELPFPGGSFAGVMLWYSIIHTPPEGQARIFAEAARVLQPGGHLLAGFQYGRGTRDVGELYRVYGYDLQLTRHNYTADEVVAHAESVGLHEVCRLVRQPGKHERDGQAIVLARAD